MSQPRDDVLAEDQEALRALSATYASAADRRDHEAFIGTFVPDGVVEYGGDGTNLTERREGAEELRTIVELIARYDKTFHLLGQSTYRVDGEEATGEVYCVAHHVTGTKDWVMYIRYDDRYHREDGRWHLVNRRVVNDWNELRTIKRPDL